MPEPARSTVGVEELTEREREILRFERGWWKYTGAKEEAILDRFGCSLTRYLQEVNSIIDEPAALAFEPMVVKRLRRLREERARARSRAGAR